MLTRAASLMAGKTHRNLEDFGKNWKILLPEPELCFALRIPVIKGKPSVIFVRKIWIVWVEFFVQKKDLFIIQKVMRVRW